VLARLGTGVQVFRRGKPNPPEDLAVDMGRYRKLVVDMIP
jgi:hypothetical protein